MHIGLAKTATTSLQHNLFQPLHEQGKVKFLGKLLEIEKDTGRVNFLNYTGGIIREYCEEKIDVDIVGAVDRILDSGKLNIFSDEGISVF